MKISAILLVLILSSSCSFQFNTGEQAEVVATAGTPEEQMKIDALADGLTKKIDAKQWALLWRSASSLLKDQESQSTFSAKIGATRAMFGEPKRREKVGYSFEDRKSGDVPGYYGIVFYKTDFARADGVDEQVVLVREGNEWRLAGYWAKKTASIKFP